ncbi:MAG: hypothetical protein ACR2QJ_07900, partial [Geminicoccaceae bacterium]
MRIDVGLPHTADRHLIFKKEPSTPELLHRFEIVAHVAFGTDDQRITALEHETLDRPEDTVMAAIAQEEPMYIQHFIGDWRPITGNQPAEERKQCHIDVAREHEIDLGQTPALLDQTKCAADQAFDPLSIGIVSRSAQVEIIPAGLMLSVEFAPMKGQPEHFVADALQMFYSADDFTISTVMAEVGDPVIQFGL